VETITIKKGKAAKSCGFSSGKKNRENPSAYAMVSYSPFRANTPNVMRLNEMMGISTTITIDQKIQFSSDGLAAISDIALRMASGMTPSPNAVHMIPAILLIIDIVKWF
jgi:hypothetical protein